MTDRGFLIFAGLWVLFFTLIMIPGALLEGHGWLYAVTYAGVHFFILCMAGLCGGLAGTLYAADDKVFAVASFFVMQLAIWII